MSNTSFLDPVTVYLDGLVHPLAREDQRTLARHRGFIAVRLLSGLGALAVLPAHLAMFGAPSAIETAGYAWFLLPLAIVWHLSRTGSYEQAHIFSAVIFAAMVGVIASLTGGGASFVLPWLIVIPLEPALYASRRATWVATAAAIVTAIVIAIGGGFGLFPPAPRFTIGLFDPHLLSVLSAVLYAGLITLGGRMDRHDDANPAIETREQMVAESTRELVTCHGRNGAVNYVSAAAEKLAGVQAAQLMGYGFFDRVHVADRPAFLTAIAETATKGKPAAIEYRLRYGPFTDESGIPAQPSFVWVETRCRANGQQVVALTSDISQRKSSEMAIEAAQTDALRAGEIKSRFLATVSHELRTPLNAIIGFSEMLTRENTMTIEPERRQDYARLIRDSGEHLLSVVNGILDVAQIESGRFAIEPAPFAIAALVESCREMMALRAEQAGVSLSVVLAGGMPEIVADQRAMRQVVINLLSNAIKFTGRGGKISITGRVERNNFVLTVADSGIGISEADLANVGSPFFQACSSYDRSYEGTGLGLSVVKGLIELHGGQTKIESRVGEGTRVTIRIPFERREPPVKQPGTVEPFPSHLANRELKKVKRRA